MAKITVLRAEYNTPAKGVVRGHWMPFASDRISQPTLENVRVWFLPGVEALEVAQYLSRGIRLANLRGFEWRQDRAAVIHAAHPLLTVYDGSIHRFLADPREKDAWCDFANLDFDGSALTFSDDIAGVVARMRYTNAPRLAISSLVQRDHIRLQEALTALSFWQATNPLLLDVGVDLLRAGNKEMGLVLQEPATTYMIARELAVLLTVLYSFGARDYGSRDDGTAGAFMAAWHELKAAVNEAVLGAVRAGLNQVRAVPLANMRDHSRILRTRTIPVRLVEQLRFCYQSPFKKWRMVWYFAFEKSTRPVSLAEWAVNLLTHHPPLHVVDETGAVIGDRARGLCRFCERR